MSKFGFRLKISTNLRLFLLYLQLNLLHQYFLRYKHVLLRLFSDELPVVHRKNATNEPTKSIQ